MDSGTLSVVDLNDYYEIYTKIANESEYIQNFCRDWNVKIFSKKKPDEFGFNGVLKILNKNLPKYANPPFHTFLIQIIYNNYL